MTRALRALERAYSPGHHGRWSARRRSDLVDDAVRALAEGLVPRVALVALGGYGRRLLCPASDVDLMVLHAERRPERVREAAERLFYPFWDAGISLGHAVRTTAECVEAARARIDVACSLLDGRLVWGDGQLFRDLEDGLRRSLAKDAGGFISRLRADATDRHERHRSCSVSLEPDLKDGAGGLRDIHSVGWAGRVLVDAPDTVVQAELLRARERDVLTEAEEFTVRLRSALHLEASKRTDRLFMEYQARLAGHFGFEATEGLPAEDALMRGLFEHARHVEHATVAFFDRAEGREGRRARVSVEAAAPFSAEDAMAAFALSASSGSLLPPDTLDALEAADLGPVPYLWTDRSRQAFLDILAAGGMRTLEAMDRSGFLTRFLPEWEAVRCRPQRDPYHRFSVDVHLLRAAAEAARILDGDGDDPVLATAGGSVKDRDAVLLGALLHDIGKTGEGTHVATGVRIAAGALERMGVTGTTRDNVLFLVESHLLLSDTATRRDLSDENLVIDVAAKVGDPERLAMLFVLTIADARATGPHARTPWRLALVRELVGKVERVLESGEIADDAAALGERLERIRTLLAGEDSTMVGAYLARMPRPYLLAVPPETAASHLRLVGPPLTTAEVRTTATRGERPETYDLTVVAADRPGLLAKIAGALALCGLNILSAQAFTTEDGVAVDLFIVETAFQGEADEDRWRRFRSVLRKALEGRLSLEYRVREKRRHYPPAPGGVPIEVSVLQDASDFYTVVEVSAADRIGLLFDLARTFHELSLDVHLAKVATYGTRVVDAFYVRDLYGRKVQDADHAREVERAIVARLADEPG